MNAFADAVAAATAASKAAGSILAEKAGVL